LPLILYIWNISWRGEPRVRLTTNEANSEGEWNGPLSWVLRSARIVVLLTLAGLTTYARCLQSQFPSTMDAAFPKASEAPARSAQSMPEEPLPGSIHGVVVNRDGVVYEGVRVELAQTASTATSVRAVTSDSNGEFNFTDVPPGAFSLTVSSNGFATQVISGFLHSGESYEVHEVVLLVASVTNVRVTASPQEIALEQFRLEEKQRVFGVIPNFYVTYVPNAPPLTRKQKFHLALKSSTDPVNFVLTGVVAGIQQADNTFSGYGQGAQGFAKRYAANYADGFIGTMIGGAILPSLLKQDPRYFYKGTGTIRSRALYAIAMSVVCKGDNGHWQPNYSGIIGGLAAGGISNLYYPASDRNGAALTFENALIGIAGGAAENLVQEFIIRKLTPNVPKYVSPKQ
jgi:hypothetical protein